MNARVVTGYLLLLPLIVFGAFQDLYVWSKQTLAGPGGDAGEVGMVLALTSALMFIAGIVILWREHRRSAEPS